MPHSRMRRSSMADMMAKASPLNKGSLLTSIDNLLKTIESSESAVMIPTLLRDKCEFDAWELLFVAKILKASILGHSDLVEFYMSHLGQQKSFAAAAATPPPTGILRHQASSPALSPASTPMQYSAPQANGQPSNGHSLTSSASSVSSQASSTSTAATATAPSSASTGGWVSATSQLQHQPQQQQQPHQASRSASSASSLAGNNQQKSVEIELASLLAAKSPPVATSPTGAARQPQPPSLLQLTTTNNHINHTSIGSGAAADCRGLARSLTASGTIEQLTNSTLQLLNGSNGLPPSSAEPAAGGQHHPAGALSISTTMNSQQQQQQPTTPVAPTSLVNQQPHHHELRSSRSAGCLFRNNQNQSGASSPRTPATPTTPSGGPQAETLAANGAASSQQLLACDPSMPVKLLLQIEQLKSSMTYVTNLLENVVELYKKSIDNIA